LSKLYYTFKKGVCSTFYAQNTLKGRFLL